MYNNKNNQPIYQSSNQPSMDTTNTSTIQSGTISTTNTDSALNTVVAGMSGMNPYALAYTNINGSNNNVSQLQFQAPTHWANMNVNVNVGVQYPSNISYTYNAPLPTDNPSVMVNTTTVVGNNHQYRQLPPLHPPPTSSTTNSSQLISKFMYNDMNSARQSLHRRLTQDVEHFQSSLNEFVHFFNAHPLKDEISVWHFNLWPSKGSYQDLCIHGVIEFPWDYPRSPPSIHLSNAIPHPNINSVANKNWVNLQMLSNENWKMHFPVEEMFRQLSDLFNIDLNKLNNASTIYSDSSITSAQQSLKTYTCMWCGHSPQSPHPAKGAPLPQSRRQLDLFKSNFPLKVENQEYQWKYCRIKQIEANFGKVYFEARIESSILGPNSLTTIQIGWSLQEENETLGNEYEHIVLGNRYVSDTKTPEHLRIQSNLIHKKPFIVNMMNNNITKGFGEVGDCVTCSADFENEMISFWINGDKVASVKMPDTFLDEKALIPVVGLSGACVFLNWTQLNKPIIELQQRALCVQEYLSIDRSDWLWKRGTLVQWGDLFAYGIPPANEFNPEMEKLRSIVSDIYAFLSFEDLNCCRPVCKTWNETVNKANLVHRSKLRCYYTCKSYDESRIIIGILLRLKFDESSINRKNKRNNNFGIPLILSVDTSKAYNNLSWNAWNSVGIRIDSKHDEFSHFLPMIINNEHGKNAETVLKRCIASMMDRQGFTPKNALTLISNLISLVIQSLSKKFNELKAVPDTHVIMDKLNLFSVLHHIMIFMHNRYGPAMQEEADERIQRFADIKQSAYRTSSNIANLGSVVVFLLVSENYTWHTIRRLYIEELFARDYRRIIKQCPEMREKVEDGQWKDRLKEMYVRTEESRRFTRLLVVFVMILTRGISLNEFYDKYNESFGAPVNIQWIYTLEDQCHDIYESNTWGEFFSGIFVQTPEHLSPVLYHCFLLGVKNGYYSMSKKKRYQTRKTDDYQIDRKVNNHRQRQQQMHNFPTNESNLIPNKPVHSNRFKREFFSGGNNNRRGRGSPTFDNFDNNRMMNRSVMGGRMRGRGGGQRGRFNNISDNNRGGGGRRGRGSYNERRNQYSNNMMNGRGGGYAGRGGGRGGGRGSYSNNNYYSRNQNQSKVYNARSVHAMTDLPDNILRGCSDNVKEFTDLQMSIMNDMCLGSDMCVVSPAGTGKSLSVVLCALYRVCTSHEPCQVLIITGNGIHTEDVGQKITLLGQYVDNLHVYIQTRKSAYVQARDCRRGRNIFVCTGGTAIALLERANQVISQSIISIFLLDADSLLVGLQFDKIQKSMAKLPANVPTAILTNSLSLAAKQNAKLIFGPSIPKRHTNTPQNLFHWFIYCTRAAQRAPMLLEFLKVNPRNQGIICCIGPRASQVIMESLKRGEMTCAILSSDSVSEAQDAIEQYISGSISYIIVHEHSPAQLLYQIHAQIIVNYDLRVAGTYLKRVSVTGLVDKRVNVVSIVDDSQSDLFEEIERVCLVKMKELPENVAEILADETPIINAIKTAAVINTGGNNNNMNSN